MTRRPVPPAADVLIPAYNAERTIGEAVASIQRQSVRDIAIHIVDDGSTDATPAILHDIAAADPRVHVHSRPNGGIVEALNAGLRHCTAEFIARHDADDIAYPERLAVQLACLRARPEFAAVGAAARHIDATGAPTGSIARLDQPDRADPFRVPAKEPYLIHPFLTVRRAAIEAVGGYRHACHAEDSDLYWRLSEQGRLHNLPDLLGDYRLHADSISGGSIVNGRIMAIGSQLGAFSARRRRRGVPDLPFPKDRLAAFRAAGSLAAMVTIAARDLDPDELEPFEESVAAKLLELASYRPYELDGEDCAFVGHVARRGFGHLPPVERVAQIRRISGTAARIAVSGRMDDALRMVAPGLGRAFALRYLARIALPGRIRGALRRDATRDAPVK